MITWKKCAAEEEKVTEEEIESVRINPENSNYNPILQLYN